MPVDIKYIDECIFEARRFMDKAVACRTNLAMANGTVHETPENKVWPDKRLTAAVRRSSMDLTRALADLRRS